MPRLSNFAADYQAVPFPFFFAGPLDVLSGLRIATVCSGRSMGDIGLRRKHPRGFPATFALSRPRATMAETPQKGGVDAPELAATDIEGGRLLKLENWVTG